LTISVASADLVIRNICGINGCKRRPDFDTSASYAFSYKDPANPESMERLFFIPHALTGEGYTQAQLEEIEGTLAYCGFDLLPLDPNLH
jgi:hypothetical protein